MISIWSTLIGVRGATGSAGLSLTVTDDTVVGFLAPAASNNFTGSPGFSLYIGTSSVIGALVPGATGSAGLSLAWSGATLVAFFDKQYSRTVTTQNASYAVLATDFYVRTSGTSLSTNITYSLPAAVLGANYKFKKNDSSAFAVSVAPNGSDTIDGVNSPRLLQARFDSIEIIAGAANTWEIV